MDAGCVFFEVLFLKNSAPEQVSPGMRQCPTDLLLGLEPEFVLSAAIWRSGPPFTFESVPATLYSDGNRPLPALYCSFMLAVPLWLYEKNLADTLYISPVGRLLPMAPKSLFLNDPWLDTFHKKRLL